MHHKKSPLARAFASLGSVQFTMVLLLVGVVAMTVGTLIEKDAGAEAARSSVYHTAWFDLFLLLIGVNLIVAVVNRFPLRRTQWSFVLTHFSIVLLLVGAWISRHYGFEGSVAIREGSDSASLILDSKELVIGQGEAARHIPVVAPRPGDVLAEAQGTDPRIECLDVRPDSVVTTRLVEAPGGTPGLAVRMVHSGMSFPVNLLAERPEAMHVDLGPVAAEVKLVRTSAALRQELAAVPANTRTLLLRTKDGQERRISLADAPAEPIELGGGLTATVTASYDCARVVDGELQEVPGGGYNPAARVEVRRGDALDTYIAFAQFPDFNIKSIGGDAPLVEAVQLEAVEAAKHPHARFVVGPDGSLFAQRLSADGRSEAEPIAPGGSISLGRWSATLDRFLPQADLELVAGPPAEGQDGTTCLQLAIGSGQDRQTTWLPLGYLQRVDRPEGPLTIGFERATQPLPFRVELQEFRVGYYPGSRRPSSYESHITLADTKGHAPPFSTVVAMNRPTDYMGYRLFQQSYVLGEGNAPDTTILSVSHDPGVPVVYVSFVLLILGVGWYLLGGSDRSRKHHILPHDRGNGGSRIPAKSLQNRSQAMHAKPATRVASKVFASVLVFSALSFGQRTSAQEPGALPVESTAGWAIQFEGRVKPLETAAQEIFQSISGRSALDGLSPLELFWDYHFDPTSLGSHEHIRIDSRELKAALGIAPSTHRVSFDSLMKDPKFQELVEAAIEVENAGGTKTLLQEGALATYDKMQLLAGVVSGSILTVVPSAEPGGKWRTPDSLSGSTVSEEAAVYQGFGALAQAFSSKDADGFQRAADGLTASLRAVSPGTYPSASAIDRELTYNHLGAFSKAWVAYLLGFLLLLWRGARAQRGKVYWAAMACLVAGIALHVTGFALRWAIAGRAPVSNMYESLVFMSLGGAVLGTLLEFLQPKAFFGMAAGLAGFLSLLFAQNLPVDSAINPLVPVLANTSWLSIHVMTIMLSYSAFALSMVLAHFVLFIQLRDPGRTEKLRSLSSLLYRMLQIGLLFLAAGIAFGAIWANRSWGRYWGWDPKETWSLITFFVYLALIHARFAGWLHHFGTAAWTIVCFLSVVMTYYGVNFVLGTGLHAYGFSSGGTVWVVTYLVLEALVIALATWRYRSMASPAHRVHHRAEAHAH